MENTLSEIKDLLERIESLNVDKDNISIDDLDINREELFDEMLDNCYEKYIVCGIEFYPSEVLKNCDPIAYRCLMNDYLSDLELNSLSEYQDKIEEIDEEVEEIKQVIHEIIDKIK